MQIISSRLYVPAIVSFVTSLVVLVIVNYFSFPWIDEIGTADTPINVVLRGEWHSDIWQYTYNPLHAFLLIIWIKVWGVSHMAICSLNVLLAFICSLVFLKIFEIWNKTNKLTLVCFVLSYWLSLTFSLIEIYGRLDILVMLFTILVIHYFFRDFDKANATKIFFFSFLLMASNIYTVPIIIIFQSLRFLFLRNRKEIVYQTIVFIAGVFLSFICICWFYYSRGILISYLHTYYAFNDTIASGGDSFINRLFRAYSIDPYNLVLFCSFLVYGLIKKKNISYFYASFILLIPLFMTIAGRYQPYYSWLFSISVLFFLYYMYSLSNNTLKILTLSILSIGLINLLSISNNISEMRNLQNECRSFFSKNRNIINTYDCLLTSEPLFYYDAVENHRKIWYKYKSAYLDPVPNWEKDESFVRLFSKDPEHIKTAMEFIKKQCPYIDVVPKEGGFIASDDNQVKAAYEYLSSKSYDFELITRDKSFTLYHFCQEK